MGLRPEREHKLEWGRGTEQLWCVTSYDWRVTEMAVNACLSPPEMMAVRPGEGVPNSKSTQGKT